MFCDPASLQGSPFHPTGCRRARNVQAVRVGNSWRPVLAGEGRRWTQASPNSNEDKTANDDDKGKARRSPHTKPLPSLPDPDSRGSHHHPEAVLSIIPTSRVSHKARGGPVTSESHTQDTAELGRDPSVPAQPTLLLLS